jgi:hypothetical protein
MTHFPFNGYEIDSSGTVIKYIKVGRRRLSPASTARLRRRIYKLKYSRASVFYLKPRFSGRLKTHCVPREVLG